MWSIKKNDHSCKIFPDRIISKPIGVIIMTELVTGHTLAPLMVALFWIAGITLIIYGITAIIYIIGYRLIDFIRSVADEREQDRWD
jgi:hypothetical protein